MTAVSGKEDWGLLSVDALVERMMVDMRFYHQQNKCS